MQARINTGTLVPTEGTEPVVTEPQRVPAVAGQTSTTCRRSIALAGQLAGIGTGFALVALTGVNTLLAAAPLWLAFRVVRLPLCALTQHVMAPPPPAPTDAANLSQSNTRALAAGAWPAVVTAAQPVTTGISIGLGLMPALRPLVPQMGACWAIAGAVIGVALALHGTGVVHNIEKPPREPMLATVQSSLRAASSHVRTRMAAQILAAASETTQAEALQRHAAAQREEALAWNELRDAEGQWWAAALDTVTLGRSWRRVTVTCVLLLGASFGLHGAGFATGWALLRMAPALYLPMCASVRALEHGYRPTAAPSMAAAAQALTVAALVGVLTGSRR